MNWDQVAQVWIMVFSGSAAALISTTGPLHRWGHVVGLVSQPAYVYTTYHHGQWAMFILTLWFAYNWSRGVYNRFWRKA